MMHENRHAANPATWRVAAGLLISGRDAAGRDFVLLGKKRPSRTAWKQSLASFGFSLHGWSIPFGQMDMVDGGSFARCAIRETVEEALGEPEGKPYDYYENKLAEVLGLSKTDLLPLLEPEEGWRWRQTLGMDSRTFHLRVRLDESLKKQEFPRTYEFPEGVRWCEFKLPDSATVDGHPLDRPCHVALADTLRHFQSRITAGA